MEGTFEGAGHHAWKTPLPQMPNNFLHHPYALHDDTSGLMFGEAALVGTYVPGTYVLPGPSGGGGAQAVDGMMQVSGGLEGGHVRQGIDCAGSSVTRQYLA